MPRYSAIRPGLPRFPATLYSRDVNLAALNLLHISSVDSKPVFQLCILKCAPNEIQNVHGFWIIYIKYILFCVNQFSKMFHGVKMVQ